MKTHLLIPALAAFALSANAQNPGGPPPPQNPGSPQHSDRREEFRKKAEQFRQHHGPGAQAQPQVNPQEREEHIREAIKHLKAAGLGFMAGHLEESIKKFLASGHGPGAPQQPGASGPQHPHFPGHGQAFGAPAPFTPPMQQHGESHRHEHHNFGSPQSQGGNDDLRAQVQRLSHQVEELTKMMHSRMGEHHEGHPQAGPHKDGEHHEQHRPQAEPQKRSDGNREHHDAPPQRRPEGNRDAPPQPRRDGDRPEPKRDGAAEEIKPALNPQSDSIE